VDDVFRLASLRLTPTLGFRDSLGAVMRNFLAPLFVCPTVTAWDRVDWFLAGHIFSYVSHSPASMKAFNQTTLKRPLFSGPMPIVWSLFWLSQGV
jgi:hypothetical protein